MLRPFFEPTENDQPLALRNPSWNLFHNNLHNKRFPALSIDIVDHGNKYCLQADLPGMKKENISISLQGRDLRIEGERTETKLEENENYHHQERFSGKFVRVLKLPEDVILDGSKYSATYNDGVLHLEMPKREDAVKKQIHQINVK